jgi:hypothetical protein
MLPLSPSEFRDSVVYYTRTAKVLDSITAAGWDTALVRHGRELLISPILVNVNFDCGGGGGANNGPQNPDRRAEGGVIQSNNSSGCTIDIGGSKVDCDKWVEVLKQTSPTTPLFAGACASSLGNATRSSNTFFEAGTGDYLISMVVAGKTYRQVLRIERAGPGEVKP